MIKNDKLLGFILMQCWRHRNCCNPFRLLQLSPQEQLLLGDGLFR